MAKLSDRQIEKCKATFGTRLRDIRVRRGLTQAGLVKATGIDQSSISLFESGDKEPLLSTLFKLAAGLNVSPMSLLQQPGKRIA